MKGISYREQVYKSPNKCSFNENLDAYYHINVLSKNFNNKKKPNISNA